MYAIYMKKIDQAKWLPIMQSQQTTDIKQARKYRKLDIAIADYERCIANHPNFGWSIRDIKENESVRNNLMQVLPIWNKQLGRV